MDLNGILIGTEDPKGLADFYRKLLGEPTWDEGVYVGWVIGTGSITIGEHSEVKGPNADPGRVIWNLESTDVKGDFERFRAAGATVVREPYNPGVDDGAEMWIATLADPENNYFQLTSPM